MRVFPAASVGWIVILEELGVKSRLMVSWFSLDVLMAVPIGECSNEKVLL